MANINWSAIPKDSLAGRLLRFPLKAVPRRAVMTIRRGPAKNLKWIAGSGDHGYWLGTYELPKQLALARRVKPGMTIYDIGAHAGFYTLFFSRLIGPRGHVYAFEPCALEMRHLIRHLAINQLDNVHAVGMAVTDRCGPVGLTTDRLSSQNGITSQSTLIVSAITLDEAPFPPPDLIKMDVEGAESSVLAGATRLLSEKRPVMFIALHGAEQRKLCAELLSRSDYRVFDLAGRRLNGAPDTDEIIAEPD